LLAILKTAHYCWQRAPFNVGCWGMIFPLGVYSLATLTLARTTHLAFFTVVGCILVTCLAGLWFAVAMLTIDGLWRGYFFIPRTAR
jgi:tellurite resistance protein TehA-like permease